MFSDTIRKILLSAFLTMFAAAPFALPQTVPQPARVAKHHTVFQMSEAEAEWSPLIAHVTNLMNALEHDGGVDVEVVFFGEGINMVRRSNTKFAESMRSLADRGVVFAACQNSMRSRQIKSEDLFPFAIEVDSGVAELTRKQEAGWAYIK